MKKLSIDFQNTAKTIRDMQDLFQTLLKNNKQQDDVSDQDK